MLLIVNFVVLRFSLAHETKRTNPTWKMKKHVRIVCWAKFNKIMMILLGEFENNFFFLLYNQIVVKHKWCSMFDNYFHSRYIFVLTSLSLLFSGICVAFLTTPFVLNINKINFLIYLFNDVYDPNFESHTLLNEWI